ncbi:hypothetical protein JOM56_005373 [Amanita muscaria]
MRFSIICLVSFLFVTALAGRPEYRNSRHRVPSLSPPPRGSSVTPPRNKQPQRQRPPRYPPPTWNSNEREPPPSPPARDSPPWLPDSPPSSRPGSPSWSPPQTERQTHRNR